MSLPLALSVPGSTAPSSRHLQLDEADAARGRRLPGHDDLGTAERLAQDPRTSPPVDGTEWQRRLGKNVVWKETDDERVGFCSLVSP